MLMRLRLFLKAGLLSLMVGLGSPAFAHEWSAPKPGAVKYYDPDTAQDFTLLLIQAPESNAITGSMWMKLPHDDTGTTLPLATKLTQAREHLASRLQFTGAGQPLALNISFPILESSRHESHDGFERVVLKVDTVPDQVVNLKVNTINANVFLAEIYNDAPKFTSVSSGQLIELFKK